MSFEQRLTNLGISQDLPEEEIARRLRELREAFLAAEQAALEEHRRKLDAKASAKGTAP